MNRRSFFKFLGAGAATLALSEAIPFGRVWSFPSKIVVPVTGQLTSIHFPWVEYERLVRFDMAYGFGNLYDDAMKCRAELTDRTLLIPA